MRIDQHIRRSDLTGRNIVLNIGHHHRNDGDWLCHTGRLADHTRLDHLRFDLTETGDEAPSACLRRNEDTRGPHQWIDNIAFAQREGMTHVVFGRSARSRLEILMKGLTLARFRQEVKDAAVQVVPL